MTHLAPCIRAALVAALVVSSACIEPEDAADDAAAPLDDSASTEPVSDDTVFFDTVVELKPDGTFVVGKPRPITAGEQRAENALREAIEAGEAEPPGPAIAQDFSCLYDSFWMYSRTDFTGSRICFRGLGPAFLEEYTRYVLVDGKPFALGNWRIQTGSYWPGADAGVMRNQYFIYDPATAWELTWTGWGNRRVLSQAGAAYFVSLY